MVWTCLDADVASLTPLCVDCDSGHLRVPNFDDWLSIVIHILLLLGTRNKKTAECQNDAFWAVPANWRLVRARYYLCNPAPIQVHIWDHNKVDRFTPFTAYPSADGWFEVDLMGLGLYTTAEQFYVGFTSGRLPA